MLDKIKELIVNYVEIDPDTITEDSRFIEDMGFNSYDFMSILGDIETEFSITVDENDILDMHTVGDAIKYIEDLRG